MAIEPESITEVDEATRDAWVAETASQTRERSKAVESGDAPFGEQAREACGADVSLINDTVTGFTETDHI